LYLFQALGEVWEEDEFWIELSWRMDPDGSLGIRDHFISPYRPGEKINVDEYYQYIFEHTEGLPEKAALEGMTPLDYMRKYGAFEVESHAYQKNLKELSKKDLEGSTVDKKSRTIYKDGKSIGLMVDGNAFAGFPTLSRKQEFFSQTMIDWKWPEYDIPVEKNLAKHILNTGLENNVDFAFTYSGCSAANQAATHPPNDSPDRYTSDKSSA